MSTTGPRFLNEDPDVAAEDSPQRPVVPDEALSSPALPRGPLLLEAEPNAPAALQSLWNPSQNHQTRTAIGNIAWVAIGLVTLVISWIVLSCFSVVLTIGAHSQALEIIAAVCLASSLLLVVRGLGGEWRSYRKLQQVAGLQAILMRPDQRVETARTAALTWVRAIAATIPDAATVEHSLRTAETAGEVVSILRNRVAEPLWAMSEQLGRRVALQGAGLIAISPHASWDGLFVAVRGLLVIRQVAALYGLRPSAAATIALMRKVAMAAGGTAGIELLSQSVADHVLHNVPIVKHIAGALPGSSAAALRLYRLARITAEACSPIPR